MQRAARLGFGAYPVSTLLKVDSYGPGGRDFLSISRISQRSMCQLFGCVGWFADCSNRAVQSVCSSEMGPFVAFNTESGHEIGVTKTGSPTFNKRRLATTQFVCGRRPRKRRRPKRQPMSTTSSQDVNSRWKPLSFRYIAKHAEYIPTGVSIKRSTERAWVLAGAMPLFRYASWELYAQASTRA